MVSWQTVSVVVSIVIHTSVAICVAVVHRAEAVASFVDEEAGSVEGDCGGGVVLGVRHLEPGAEDQAPWISKDMPEQKHGNFLSNLVIQYVLASACMFSSLSFFLSLSHL